MKNVLVFPCGSEIGLEVNRALTNSKHFTLFGGSSADDHGKFVYENYIDGIPIIEEDDFIEKINKVVDEYKIDFIIPAHDSAVLKIAEHQDELKAVVITSCVSTCRICRSKRMTYKVFEKILRTPKVYGIEYYKVVFPVFLKPDVGQGTKGTYKADTWDDILFYTKKDHTLLVLEYLPGKEYTVDCFTNKNGELLFVKGRERRRINNGISVNSKHTDDTRFETIAKIINNTLLFQGAWFFQVKEDSTGELVLMEIAPRIAGTMELFRADGTNFIELSLFDRMGDDVSVIHNDLDIEIDRALEAKYHIKVPYNCVYIDFDDTIISKGYINTNVMKFLYQSRNQGNKIVLLSKHKRDIFKTLDEYAISHLLFNEIKILSNDKNKADFIRTKNSIFIDDSFAERKNVYDKLHIPVFSLDAIEALLE